MRKPSWSRCCGGLLLAVLLAVPALAQAREVPVVTGEHWVHSTPRERKAFLVGAATIMTKTQQGALSGAVIGAGTGAAISAIAGGNVGIGAGIGGALGGIAGGIIGHQQERRGY